MKPSSLHAGAISCCLFFLSIFSTVAQPPAPPSPGSLPELLSAIEAVMKREQIPGLMLVMVNSDSIIFSGGLGYSDLATGRKVDGKQKFRLGSTTKLLVAMGILHLVRQGALTLDTKLKDVAPEAPFHNPWEETHPVRIINLLEHTTGFTDAFMNKSINLGQTDKSGLAVLKLYADQMVCRFRPGTMPLYTNTNYTVLGYVIEKVSGMGWAEYLQTNVLAPVGMLNTDFKLRPTGSEYATGYLTSDGRQVPVPAFALHSNGAHGSMNSCADDMARLVRFFLNNWRTDTTQWLPVSDLADMENVHTTLAARHQLKNGYGLGNHIEAWHPKCTFHGHGGTIQGFVSHMIYDRERGVGMMIAKNGGYNDARIAMLVTDFLTRHLPPLERVEKEVPADSIQPFLGYYRPAFAADHYGFLQNLVSDVAVSMNGKALVLSTLSGRPVVLNHMGKLKFREHFGHEESYVFGHDEQGNKILMSTAPRGGTHIIKTSLAYVLLKRSLAAGGLIALTLSILIGVFSIVSIALKRDRSPAFPVAVLPMLATLSLAIGLSPLVQWEANYLSFTRPNGVTLTIFFGTLFFAVFSAAGVWFLYTRWKHLKSIRAKILYAFSALGTAAVAGSFLMHGMIAPMVWNW
ncbi:beta-lactamase family protein [Fulvivirgaceae bacterium PWU4]|uniref:Beta-lactamase family protein n=1 Tax=Chryseosolibacter histidini TaxID=2782349 RepID=A0AAP2DUQ8_9BACT|nr:serine hydrolase domain-containing protein [Chryseosolibacter histidini]MBT1701337.1 beta-lactamase family protein [Chryseosolibacter histidini]